MLDAARKTGAQAIHPGYGFLVREPELCRRCEQAGIVFLGPTPEQMRAFGLKHTARELAQAANVPLRPASAWSPTSPTPQPKPLASAIR